MKVTNRFLNFALLLALLGGGGCLSSRELQPDLRMVAGEAEPPNTPQVEEARFRLG